MKKRRLLAPLIFGTITTSIVSAQNSILALTNSNSTARPEQAAQRQDTVTNIVDGTRNDRADDVGDADNALNPAEVFLIISPIIAVVIMGLVLAGIVLKNKHETRVEEKKVRYEEFVDIENATENVELMVQNREGFS